MSPLPSYLWTYKGSERQQHPVIFLGYILLFPRTEQNSSCSQLHSVLLQMVASHLDCLYLWLKIMCLVWFLVQPFREHHIASCIYMYVREPKRHYAWLSWPSYSLTFYFLIQLLHLYHQLSDSGSLSRVWFHPSFSSVSSAALAGVCTSTLYRCTVECTSCKHAVPVCLSNSLQWLTEEIVVLPTAVAMLLACFASPLVHLNLEKRNFLLSPLLCSVLRIPEFFKFFYILICYCNTKQCDTTGCKHFQLSLSQIFWPSQMIFFSSHFHFAKTVLLPL